jgi:hypothetical protein
MTPKTSRLWIACRAAAPAFALLASSPPSAWAAGPCVTNVTVCALTSLQGCSVPPSDYISVTVDVSCNHDCSPQPCGSCICGSTCLLNDVGPANCYTGLTCYAAYYVGIYRKITRQPDPTLYCCSTQQALASITWACSTNGCCTNKTGGTAYIYLPAYIAATTVIPTWVDTECCPTGVSQCTHDSIWQGCSGVRPQDGAANPPSTPPAIGPIPEEYAETQGLFILSLRAYDAEAGMVLTHATYMAPGPDGEAVVLGEALFPN